MAYAQFYTLPASAHIVMCINNACSAAVAAFLSFGYCENGFLCGRSKHYKHQLLCKSQGPVPWLPRLLVLYCIWAWATRRSCAVVQAVILGEFSLLAAGITAARPVDIAESAKLSERRFLLHSFMNMHAPCVALLLLLLLHRFLYKLVADCGQMMSRAVKWSSCRSSYPFGSPHISLST